MQSGAQKITIYIVLLEVVIKRELQFAKFLFFLLFVADVNVADVRLHLTKETNVADLELSK